MSVPVQIIVTERSGSFSGRSSARVGFGSFPLSQDGEHLVDPEHGKSGGHQTGGSEDVPPVEEAKRDALGDAVEPEADQCHGGEDLDAQRRPG